MKRTSQHIYALGALLALGVVTSLSASADLSDSDHPMGCELYVARAPTSGRTSSDSDLNNWFKQLNADCDPSQGSCPNGGYNGIVKVGQFAMSHDNKSLVFNYSNDSSQPIYFNAPPPPSDPDSSISIAGLKAQMTNVWNTGSASDCITTHQLAGAGSDAEMDHNSMFSCHDNGSWSDHVWVKQDGDYLPSRGSILPWQIASGTTIHVLGRNPGFDMNPETKPANAGINQLIFAGDGCNSLVGARAWNPKTKCQFTHSNSVCTDDAPDARVKALQDLYTSFMDNPAMAPDPKQSATSIGMYSGTASSRPTGSPPVMDSSGAVQSSGAQ